MYHIIIIVTLLHYCRLHVARDCGSPGVLDNGHIGLSAGTVLGSIATYSCDTGFSLNGVMVRECGTDGSWADSVPTCMSKQVLSLH